MSKILITTFFESIWWYFTIIPPILLYHLFLYCAKCFNISPINCVIFGFATIQVFVFIISLGFKISDYNNDIESYKQKLSKDFEYRKEQIERLLDEEKAKINRVETRMHQILETRLPFSVLAKMKNDAEIIIFDNAIKHLRYKSHPALKAAEEVKRLKKLYAECNTRATEMEYKYDYICSIFPSLSELIENDEDLLAISEHFKTVNSDEVRDMRSDYLSREEYVRLSEDEKSQLSLDRYIKSSRKSKWQIGRDYEMSCAFQLVQEGYKVDMFGIKNGLNDLGRDLIATKQDMMGNSKVLIIQCKNWASNHTIHENVIMQLYGTMIMFKLTNNLSNYNRIEPVLMVPSYSQISGTARQFADILNVKIERLDNIEFPRIKCNINNGSKIYHLPFDQQYDRTEIKLKGECYAYTVKDAVSKGFRRAHRYYM